MHLSKVGCAQVGPKPQDPMSLYHLNKAKSLSLVLQQVNQGKHECLL